MVMYGYFLSCRNKQAVGELDVPEHGPLGQVLGRRATVLVYESVGVFCHLTPGIHLIYTPGILS